LAGFAAFASTLKPWPAVLQADAEVWLDTARAEAHVVALDEAHHHAVFVGGGQVDRAALDRIARAEVLRLLQVDQLRPAGQVGAIEHLIDADFHRRGLGHEAVNVGEGQLHGLDLQVLRVDAVHGQACHIEMAQNAQSDQRGDALPVGWNLVQRIAAVVLRDGLDPLGLVRWQSRWPSGCRHAFR
jgi:hypothetical protein